MGPGGIATIIAASSLAVIAVAVAYTVVRASRLIDEITATVSLINKPLNSFTKAAKSVEDLLKYNFYSQTMTDEEIIGRFPFVTISHEIDPHDRIAVS